MGDSALHADHLASKLPAIIRAVEQSELSNARKRTRLALSAAERVQRWDDDGCQTASHIHTVISLLGPAARKPSPFLDNPGQ